MVDLLLVSFDQNEKNNETGITVSRIGSDQSLHVLRT